MTVKCFFVLGANASALSLKRLHHEIALEGLSYDQVKFVYKLLTGHKGNQSIVLRVLGKYRAWLVKSSFKIGVAFFIVVIKIGDIDIIPL